jgi:predicted transcriptional regulator
MQKALQRPYLPRWMLKTMRRDCAGSPRLASGASRRVGLHRTCQRIESIAVKAKPCGRARRGLDGMGVSRIMYVIHRYTLLNIMKTAAIGARVSDELKHAVLQLSTLSGQTVSAITEEALMEYMAWRVPQMRDLKKAIAAADRGDFASDDETAAFFAQYGA